MHKLTHPCYQHHSQQGGYPTQRLKHRPSIKGYTALCAHTELCDLYTGDQKLRIWNLDFNLPVHYTAFMEI